MGGGRCGPTSVGRSGTHGASSHTSSLSAFARMFASLVCRWYSSLARFFSSARTRASSCSLRKCALSSSSSSLRKRSDAAARDFCSSICKSRSRFWAADFWCFLAARASSSAWNSRKLAATCRKQATPTHTRTHAHTHTRSAPGAARQRARGRIYDDRGEHRHVMEAALTVLPPSPRPRAPH